jgi:hypothetical protein
MMVYKIEGLKGLRVQLEEKEVELTKILINRDWKGTTPAPGKVMDAMQVYVATKMFDRDIIVDQSLRLIDGYVAYIVAKEFGIEKVEVKMALVTCGQQRRTRPILDFHLVETSQTPTRPEEGEGKS